jgi:hypothetical protein
MNLGGLKIRHLLPAIAVLAIVSFTAGWLAAGSADTISAGDARSLLQHIFGADFKKDQIVIKKVGSGNDPIVEAQIETAFRFVRDGRDWKVGEMRLGDRQWESIDLINEAIKAEKTRRTQAMLQKVAQSLDAYRQAKGSYVATEEFVKLLDELAPRYLGPIVQFDYWGTPLRYRGSASGYRLASSGPDRVADTPDDVIIESGELKADVAARTKGQ